VAQGVADEREVGLPGVGVPEPMRAYGAVYPGVLGGLRHDPIDLADFQVSGTAVPLFPAAEHGLVFSSVALGLRPVGHPLCDLAQS
jgi:hypothetical protein